MSESCNSCRRSESQCLCVAGRRCSIALEKELAECRAEVRDSEVAIKMLESKLAESKQAVSMLVDDVLKAQKEQG